jgi:hypothetical protein
VVPSLTLSGSLAHFERPDSDLGSACHNLQMNQADGLPLEGGNSGTVVRQGETVRRPSGPWTPLVQQFMSALRDRGLSFVPEPRGLDSQGREVIAFVQGSVPIYPMPQWVWSDDLLVDVGTKLRELHDATFDMLLPMTGWRRDPILPVEVICHGDIAPYNTVCNDERVSAFIDWDYAIPAPRGWDFGYAAYRWVSLTAPGHSDGSHQDLAEQKRRLDLFCSAYGDISAIDVVRWAVVRLDDLAVRSRLLAVEGDPIFIATVAAGHADLYENDALWLRQTYLDD